MVKNLSIILGLMLCPIVAMSDTEQMRFNVNSTAMDCSASVFGGVDTCTEYLTATAYNIPRWNGSQVEVTCFVTWTYWITEDRKNVTKEYTVKGQSVVDAHAVRIKLQVTDQLKTVKQAQRPQSTYSCDIRY